MRGEYIDFISAYCDRWCERCTFTSRCSNYAVQIATAMCDGDFKAGVELAIGAPPPENEADRKTAAAFLETLADCEPTPQELARLAREEEARDERLEELPLTTISETITLLAHRWLDDHRQRASLRRDAALTTALEVAAWDRFFIHVKLRRALRGRDEAQQGERFDDDPVQNDWNGSAKVALISIDRSVLAWGIIAKAMQDADAAQVAQELRKLRRETERAFPNARMFVRPGFDE